MLSRSLNVYVYLCSHVKFVLSAIKVNTRRCNIACASKIYIQICILYILYTVPWRIYKRHWITGSTAASILMWGRTEPFTFDGIIVVHICQVPVTLYVIHTNVGRALVFLIEDIVRRRAITKLFIISNVHHTIAKHFIQLIVENVTGGTTFPLAFVFIGHYWRRQGIGELMALMGAQYCMWRVINVGFTWKEIETFNKNVDKTG